MSVKLGILKAPCKMFRFFEDVAGVFERRFYITETSNNLAILPPKPAVLGRTEPFNWTQFYKMIPHASIGMSKVEFNAVW